MPEKYLLCSGILGNRLEKGLKIYYNDIKKLKEI
jgi:hypothetical protein